MAEYVFTLRNVRKAHGDGRVLDFFFSSRRRHTRCSRDWSSDVCSSDLLRLYNGGETDVPINLTFHPGNGFTGFGTPVTAEPRTIRAGEVLVLDNILPTLFNKSGTGGAILISTAANSSLVATGRTYTSVENNGTFGQFIPGVTPAEGVGAGERALQILQLEESDQFRSNIGLNELTGNGATVRLTLSLPDSKVTS